MTTRYLLDTNILLHWVRGSRQLAIIEQQSQLSSSPFRPVICEVSLGEPRAFSKSLKWGTDKIEKLIRIAGEFVTSTSPIRVCSTPTPICRR